METTKTMFVPVHQVVKNLLFQDPESHFDTLGALYLSGAKIPRDEIPELMCAFSDAADKIDKGSQAVEVIVALRKQWEETEEE